MKAPAFAARDPLPQRFRELWRRTVGDESWEAAFAALDQGYSGASRVYHGWSHVLDLLQKLDAVRGLPDFRAVSFDEVELAIFFHDAVYAPERHDNEARSAALFLNFAEDRGTAVDRARVAALIEATASHAASRDPAVRLTLDLDLSILGAAPDVYASYAAAVRQEYAFVPDPLWRHGRGEVLDRFLARERIYQTDPFFTRLEAAARANLAEERRQLEAA